MLPLWDTQPHRRAPIATALLIAGCVAVFGYEVVLLLGEEAALATWLHRHGLVPARLLAGWEDPEQWQTVATSMFLHGGVAHLLGNCWFLWVFGNNVEDRLGFFGFGLFYLVTGAAAAGAQVLVDPSSSVPMVGASGAISGVLGAYLVFFPRAWVISFVPWIVPILPIPAVVFLGFWFVVQAWAGVGSLMAGTAGAGGVAWWAHAGGFLAGVCIALLLPRGGGRR
jgi:membrane associated rhomboid family serine protease